MTDCSILIGTYGDSRWEQLALERAYPSAQEQGAREVLVAHEPSGTIASVRNNLAARAEGTLLCHLDADDELAPGYLAAMRAAVECEHRWHDFPVLDTNPEQYGRECVLCGLQQGRSGVTYLVDLDEDTGRLLQGGTLPATDWVEDPSLVKPRLLVPSVQYVHPDGREEKPRIPNRPLRPLVEINRAVIGTLVPRALFLEVGGFTEGCEPWEDWELWLRCERAGAKLVEVPGAVYRAHVREGSAHRPTDPKEQERLTELYWRIRRAHEAALRA